MADDVLAGFDEARDALRAIPCRCNSGKLCAGCVALKALLDYHQGAIRALPAGGEGMRKALEECAAPFVVGDQTGIKWEQLAREFYRRMQVAQDALTTGTGEKGEG